MPRPGRRAGDIHILYIYMQCMHIYYNIIILYEICRVCYCVINIIQCYDDTRIYYCVAKWGFTLETNNIFYYHIKYILISALRALDIHFLSSCRERHYMMLY